LGRKQKTDPEAPQVPADNLSSKQRLFAMEYLANGHNATKAAMAAGYSERTARQQGSENLSKPVIRAFLQSQMAPRVTRLELTADRLEAELARVCFFDPATMFGADGRLLPVPEMPEDARRALHGFDVQAKFDWIVDPLDPTAKKAVEQVGTVTKIRLPSKVDALHLGMKRLGLLIERVDVTLRTHAELVAEAARRAVDATKTGAPN
jgi:phage terminase small subunit